MERNEIPHHQCIGMKILFSIHKCIKGDVKREKFNRNSLLFLVVEDIFFELYVKVTQALQQ